MTQPVYICGTGNVATALFEGLRKAGIKVNGIYSRQKIDHYEDTAILNYEDKAADDAIVFIAVADDHIAEVAAHFKGQHVHEVHCSGSVEMGVLNGISKGVFYPLQTWTSGMVVDWQQVPVLIETNNETLKQALNTMATSLGANPLEADSRHRAALHLAAVFANNFSNAMFDMAYQLAEKAGFDPQIMMPLIRKTVAKLEVKSPHDAQTGPAKRGDERVLQKQLNMLTDRPELAELYQKVSEWIGKRYRELGD